MSGTQAGQATAALADLVKATSQLVIHVGPGWGLAILVAILLLFPKVGVIVQLAKLLKEDREDARKRKLDTDRLTAKFMNRRSGSAKLTPPKIVKKNLPEE